MKLSASIYNSGYPLYGAKFLNDRILLVAGGGGEGNNGIPNKITALRIDFSKKKVIKRFREIVLDPNDDSPTTLDAAKNIILVGCNENSEKIKSGSGNHHIRKFDYENDHLKFVAGIDFDGSKNPDDYTKLVYMSKDATVGAIASSAIPTVIRIIDPNDLTEKYEIDTGHDVKDMHFSPDGKVICYITPNTLEVISIVTGRFIIRKTDFDKSWILSKIRFINDDTVLVAAVLKNNKQNGIVMTTISLKSGNATVLKSKLVTKQFKGITSMDIDPSGECAAIASNDNSIALVILKDLSVGKVFYQIHTFAITKVAFSPDSKYVASVSAANTVHVIEVPKDFSKSTSIIHKLWKFFKNVLLIVILAYLAQLAYVNNYNIKALDYMKIKYLHKYVDKSTIDKYVNRDVIHKYLDEQKIEQYKGSAKSIYNELLKKTTLVHHCTDNYYYGQLQSKINDYLQKSASEDIPTTIGEALTTGAYTSTFKPEIASPSEDAPSTTASSKTSDHEEGGHWDDFEKTAFNLEDLAYLESQPEIPEPSSVQEEEDTINKYNNIPQSVLSSIVSQEPSNQSIQNEQNIGEQVQDPQQQQQQESMEETTVVETIVEEPKVEEPIVEEPVVEELKVDAPIVEEPVVEEPVVEEPVVDAPIVEEPVVEEPQVEKPVVDAPIVEEPVVEEPVVEEPVVDAPIVEEPVVEEPQVEEPVVDAPIVEEPVVEEPQVDEPKLEKPKLEEPKLEEPKVEEPKVEEPLVKEPKVEEPKVEAPIAEEAKVKEPKVEEPKVKEPVVEEPVVEEPVVEEPVVDAPIVEEPVVEEPVVEEPVVDAPIVEEPVVEEPKVEKPVVEEPQVDEPKLEEPKLEAPIAEEPKVEEPKVKEPKVERGNTNQQETQTQEQLQHDEL
ncbi:hypothetical protein TPHA_0H02270 [Tetrapisispora phaffii CBS 4417]|uniref:Guanine nucleotide-exchange factor SEC12 n=1 Tax=Tetrapisispora phaffii (strain ATCC 24235 / CBS 4417 / NBRC 1672 / NRRL Y-8282 / UCD 70-5) TaxID=1071381 RepID=G8BWI0_TETPH|nr:hypothetical protein TPHA_0H02270 [Tetrapisispora phaffii CBS 4417]CCE64431.1 hypothetical protein TPHA_0H02270 [Tetrapisispora phaffii CBS 4417]